MKFSLDSFASDLAKNASRKELMYLEPVNQLIANHKQVKLFNLSIFSLGLFDNFSSECIDMMRDLGMTTDQTSFIIKRLMNFGIRTSYFILCCHNREWCNPELINY